VILAVTGFAFGVGAAVSGDNARLVWELTAAHLAHIPEALVFIGIAALLYGITPRALALAWVALVYATLLAFFGPLMDLPSWTHNLSPLDHIARMPLEDLTAAPVIILTAIAATTAAAGAWAFSRRDLVSTT
jgi:ABC-2 type transport system permease protein